MVLVYYRITKRKFEGTNANKIKPTNLTQIIKILYKITKYGYRLAFFNLGVYHIYKVTKELQKYLIVIHYETVPVFPIINT